MKRYRVDLTDGEYVLEQDGRRVCTGTNRINFLAKFRGTGIQLEVEDELIFSNLPGPETGWLEDNMR